MRGRGGGEGREGGKGEEGKPRGCYSCGVEYE